ncbi:MAG: acetylornithine transaminase [bacterium]
MDLDYIKNLTDRYIAATYTRMDVSFVRGKGCSMWDSQGKEYLDFLSGIGVNNIGHSHPKLIAAVKEQVEKCIHVSNLFYIEPQAELAKILIEENFPGKIFFANSGAEANEAAIKLARRFGRLEKKGKFKIICAENSFHGRTLATLTATGQKKYHQGFEPLLPGFLYVPYNDIGAMKSAIDDEVSAIMIEPIQGEGGVIVPDTGYLPAIRALCDDNDILLILDEVQTGMGRTGRLFNYQYYSFIPDIITMAKSLAGGIPMGAMIAVEKVAKVFSKGTHASTFGGNYMASHAALAVIKIIKEEGLLENACSKGESFKEKLRALSEKYDFIKEVRGMGLMIGMELTIDCHAIVQECLLKGLIINCAAERVLRFLPPLIITHEDVDKAIDILDAVFAERER